MYCSNFGRDLAARRDRLFTLVLDEVLDAIPARRVRVAVDRGRRVPLARRAALVTVAFGLAKERQAAFCAAGEEQ